MGISNILETEEVAKSLDKYGLTKQYIKAKSNILDGHPAKHFPKQKKPKGSGIWYFRINRKYRAVGYIEAHVLKIYYIDKH